MLPKLIELDFFTLYSYPLLMGMAWGVSYLFTLNLVTKENIQTKNFKFLYFSTFIISWIGAKVFFLIFSDPKNQYLLKSEFWLGGGFVFYGGLVFGLIYYLLYSVVFKKFNYKKSYVFVPGIALGHATGRIGCFLAGCCHGSHCDLPWAITINNDSVHPVQLYETICLMIIFGFLLMLIKRNLKQYILGTYLLSYGIIRLILENFRGDLIRGVSASGISTSQIISCLIVALGSSLLVNEYLKTKKPV